MTTGLKHELYLNGAWRDVTGDVRGETAITRGRTGQSSQAQPATCTFLLDNRTGDYSRRQPTAAWYGYLSGNVPHRCSVDAEDAYIEMYGGTTDTATAPDSAALSITGDLELQIDLLHRDWHTITTLCGKYTGASNKSYALVLNSDATISLYWSDDGTTDNFATSTETVTVHYGRMALKVTFDVDNGSGGYTITFYTADTIDDSWTQLGDAVVTTSGTTSIYDGTADALVGDNGSGRFSGRIFAMKILDGIGGTEKANPDFTTQAGGASSFDDAAGNTWTINGNAEIVDRDWRFHGEIPDFQWQSDQTGNDVTIPVTSTDPQRRLDIDQSLRSAYFRGCTSPIESITDLVAYWPLEDPTGSTSMASGLANDRPMNIVGSPTLESDSASFTASEALPVMTSGAAFAGPVTSYSGTGQVQLFMMLTVPSGGVAADTRILSLITTGTAYKWDITLTTSGGLALTARDVNGTSIFSPGGVAFGLNGTSVRLGLHLTQNGANIDTTVSTLVPGASTGLSDSHTLSSYTVDAATWIAIAPDKALTGCTVGHLTIQSTVTSVFDFSDILHGNSGEQATTRIFRLADEQNVTRQVYGWELYATSLGAQPAATFYTLLRECENVDHGILASTREQLGILYRTRRSMHGQAAALTLDYSAGKLSNFIPDDDTRNVFNDYTLKRKSGSSYRYAVTSGPLSTAEPPDGIGSYPKEDTYNLSGDGQIANHCAMAVLEATTDQPRFSNLRIDLSRQTFTGDADLRRRAKETDIGDRLTIANPPSSYQPDDIDQLVIGYSEDITRFQHLISYVGIPYERWKGFEINHSRVDSEDSTVNGSHDSTTTSLSVNINSGQLWGHGDGDFDIIVSGERMTVTAVSGSSSPQTFTVTRSVNGVVKSHADGEEVHLFSQGYVVA